MVADSPLLGCGHWRPPVSTWSEAAVRRFLLIGLGSYRHPRLEWCLFQPGDAGVPEDFAGCSGLPELSARVAAWTFWTWFHGPLDVLSFL